MNTLASDGFKPASDPAAKKLDGLIAQTEANRDAAATILANQEFLNVDKLAAAVTYVTNALGTIFVGKWSGAHPNAAGAVGSIIFGLTGFDFYKDVADLTYDFAHWEWTWGHVGETSLDMVAMLPIVGVVKNIRHLDELVDGVKGVSNVAGAAGGAGRIKGVRNLYWPYFPPDISQSRVSTRQRG